MARPLSSIPHQRPRRPSNSVCLQIYLPPNPSLPPSLPSSRLCAPTAAVKDGAAPGSRWRRAAAVRGRVPKANAGCQDGWGREGHPRRGSADRGRCRGGVRATAPHWQPGSRAARQPGSREVLCLWPSTGYLYAVCRQRRGPHVAARRHRHRRGHSGMARQPLTAPSKPVRQPAIQWWGQARNSRNRAAWHALCLSPGVCSLGAVWVARSRNMTAAEGVMCGAGWHDRGGLAVRLPCRWPGLCLAPVRWRGQGTSRSW